MLAAIIFTSFTLLVCVVWLWPGTRAPLYNLLKTILWFIGAVVIAAICLAAGGALLYGAVYLIKTAWAG